VCDRGKQRGGIPEALDNGQAGIILRPGQPGELAEVLTTLLSNAKELEKWKALAFNNIEWLSASRVAAETLSIYQEALKLE
jgi:glycosyltransferase involved in cell wall biosynthesis